MASIEVARSGLSVSQITGSTVLGLYRLVHSTQLKIKYFLKKVIKAMLLAEQVIGAQTVIKGNCWCQVIRKTEKVRDKSHIVRFHRKNIKIHVWDLRQL